MGDHTTKKSLELFDFIINLGKYLNYHTDKEHPMNPNTFGSQAIDIAWFNEESSKFPLFIFEIETKTTNSIANNPTKVFGKESKVFEKPLFFFHIIIDSAKNSEKYNDLMSLFGKYNYDIFKINDGEQEQLLLKILSQHRRIQNEINLFWVIYLIRNTPHIESKIKIDRFLENVEKLIHENQFYQIGQIYSDIASRDKKFVPQYLNFLRRSFHQKKLSDLRYENYCASITAEMINTCMLFYKFDNCKGTDIIKLLNEYQNRTGTLKTIDYLPNLNRDYDIFIHDFVPFYLALSFFLLEDNKRGQKYILDTAISILHKLPRNYEFVLEHHISWALLMSSTDEAYSDLYEKLRKLVNDNGGIYDNILFSPTYKNEYREIPDSKIILVPRKEKYIQDFSKQFKHLKNDNELLQIAVKSLSHDWQDNVDYFFDLGIDLANFIIKSLEKELT